MIESIMIGFSNVLQPMNLLICLGGLFVGVLFGALPGFSATMAVAIFVPFTYVLEPGAALLLLSDLFARTVISPVILPIGAITSFLGGPLFLWLLFRGGKKDAAC